MDIVDNFAFTFRGNELTRMWSAKFKASMRESNNNKFSNNEVARKFYSG